MIVLQMPGCPAEIHVPSTILWNYLLEVETTLRSLFHFFESYESFSPNGI